MFLPASGPQFPPQYKEAAQIIPKPLDMKETLILGFFPLRSPPPEAVLFIPWVVQEGQRSGSNPKFAALSTGRPGWLLCLP